MSEEAVKSVTFSEKEKQLQEKETIVVYENQIFLTKPRYCSIEFHDYFQYKVEEKSNSEHTPEHILEFDKKLYSEWGMDHSLKKELYTRIINEFQFIKEENIPNIFQECLQKRFDSQITVTPEQIREREEYHRNILTQKFRKFLKNLSSNLYHYAKKGVTCIIFTFSEITLDYITSNGKYPIYSKYPNADGVQRTETEYIYYLLEKEYKKTESEFNDYHWFIYEYMTIIRSIFPSVIVTHEDSTTLFPNISIRMLIEIDTEISLM